MCALFILSSVFNYKFRLATEKNFLYLTGDVLKSINLVQATINSLKNLNIESHYSVVCLCILNDLSHLFLSHIYHLKYINNNVHINYAFNFTEQTE